MIASHNWRAADRYIVVVPRRRARQGMTQAWTLLVHPSRQICQRLLPRQCTHGGSRARIQQVFCDLPHDSMAFGTPCPHLGRGHAEDN